MEELLEFNDQFYILATTSVADDHSRVLKQGETFAIFDRYGDIRSMGLGEQGLYHEGTRYISRMRLRLEGAKPLLLSSTVKEDNAFLSVDLTNPDIYRPDQTLIPRGSLHIFRCVFLWQAVCYERLRIKNFERDPVTVSLSVDVDSDFADVFEVRGMKRERRGYRRAARTYQNCMILEYEGLDNVLRRMRLEFNPAPSQLFGGSAKFDMLLQPQEEATLFFSAACDSVSAPCDPSCTESDSQTSFAPIIVYATAFNKACESLKAASNRYCEVYTSNEQFNDWLNRSISDLQMMITETEAGPYPDAGVPWYSTRFGRDGIITALESLWLNPDLAAGVLCYLAQTQATALDDERDAEPGKILHEMRKGEMAALREIPFGFYYGSVDSTPLFVILAVAYYEYTGNLDLIRRLWPNIEAALQWIDIYGDRDHDGFVEYFRHSHNGLTNQGWKDSRDSVFHADGTLAEGPIALCEVQAYVYAAKLGGAQLASALGHRDMAERLGKEAEVLRQQFEKAFWCEEISTYALALDGDKRACRVRTSNAGHALFTGIASTEHALLVGKTLLDNDFFSGWGIRTVASTERVYNPMSYHNGSVWPHDNAIIASGLAHYGLKDLVLPITSGLLDSTLFVEFHRLPELLCGFSRRAGEAPTLYPVACSPQAWATGSIFMLLQAMLGLSVCAPQGWLRFQHSLLPESLQWIQIKNLRVGKSSIDLAFHRYHGDVAVSVMRKDGDIKVIAIK